MPLLAALLGDPDRRALPGARPDPAAAEAADAGRRWSTQLEGLARARSRCWSLYEDVHWIDPTTLELLGLMIERVQRLPVLVLITFRPEFSPPWTGQPHVTALRPEPPRPARRAPRWSRG